ncbi:hypothetical protein MAR_000982 [Mya arenaria]|uniref:Caspase recruitment domain-containing protein n=1 Tax=Mya arenaria TaxID=6604 RepID=A0ABY7FE56_MYAAR|nr:hypothetical protein MAR_000982 [Mya arenaria]
MLNLLGCKGKRRKKRCGIPEIPEIPEFLDLNQSKESNTKENRFYNDRVTTFKRKILNELDISQVLPYLTFIEGTEQRRISSMAKSDPKRAIDILLDILGNSPERGFVTLANIIVGYEVVDTSHHTEFLRQMAPTVREFIKPLELLPNLMNDQVINSDDKENIEQRQRNEGDISATDLLLERITCKSQFGYRSLRNALSATKQTDVAKMLDMKSIDLQENSLSIDHLRPPPPPPRTQIPPVKLETDPVDDETFSFTPAKTEKETKSDSEWDDYSTVDFLPPKRTPLGIPIPPIEKETDPDGVDHLRPPPPPPRTQIPTSQLETDPDDVDQLRPPPLPPRIPIPPSKLETDTYDVCNETRVPIRKNYENIALDCEKKTWYTAINSLFPWNLG